MSEPDRIHPPRPGSSAGFLRRVWCGAGIAFAAFVLASPAAADETAALAEQLANPIANLISVPFQYNYDCCIGELDAEYSKLNIQPVIPVSVSEDWNLITRTIMPVMDFQAAFPGLDSEFGLGDTLQSFFLSPKSTKSGIIWGVGPAFLWPTATERALGTGKLGVGPTAVILKQQSGWTYGALANQVWSYADASGGEFMPEVNQAYLQPFITYTWKDSTSLTFDMEATFDWEAGENSIPLNLVVSRIYHLGHQPVQLGVGGRAYLDGPDGGPDWGMRAVATFLFPKK